MKRKVSISFFFSLLLSIAFSLSLYGQQKLNYGIQWEVPETEIQAKKELTLFQKTGITHILANGIIPYNLMDVLASYDFDVTIQLPYTYVIEDELVDYLPEIAQSYKDYTIYYESFSDVTTLSLFHVAELNKNMVLNTLPEFDKSYPTRFNNTYIQIAGLDFPDLDAPGRISPVWLASSPSHIQHSDSLSYSKYLLFSKEPYSYAHFSRFIEPIDSGLIFIPDSYFWSGLDDTLPIDSVITATIQNPGKLFDRTSHTEAQSYPNLIIFSLVITIMIFGIHYGFEPNYRKSLSRYFGAHIFFVDDIGERRIRLGTSLLLVMLVQALLFAIAKTFFLQYTLSPVQHEILTYHLPWLTFASTTFFGSLILNGVVMLLFMLICGLWIYLAFPTLQQIYQSFLLFLWPLHLTIPIIFLYVISVLAGFSEFMAATLIVLYLIVIFGSFILTFFDMIKIERKASLLTIYLTTFIPYLIILCGVLFYLFPTFYIYDLIGMIFSL